MTWQCKKNNDRLSMSSTVLTCTDIERNRHVSSAENATKCHYLFPCLVQSDVRYDVTTYQCIRQFIIIHTGLSTKSNGKISYQRTMRWIYRTISHSRFAKKKKKGVDYCRVKQENVFVVVVVEIVIVIDCCLRV